MLIKNENKFKQACVIKIIKILYKKKTCLRNIRNFSTDSISDSQIGKLLKENTRNSELDNLTENEEDDELDSSSCDEDKEDDNAEEIKKLKKTSTNKHHQQQYRIEWEKILNIVDGLNQIKIIK
jgi:chaperonin cofactor prefoldin